MKEKINSIIIEILKNNRKDLNNIDINEETDLRLDLNFDSFNLAELTVHIEDEFGVDIFEEGIIYKVGDIYKKINK